jgi:hypothetical protein
MGDPIGSTAVGRVYGAYRTAAEEVVKITSGPHRLTEIVGFYVAFKTAEEALF